MPCKARGADALWPEPWSWPVSGWPAPGGPSVFRTLGRTCTTAGGSPSACATCTPPAPTAHPAASCASALTARWTARGARARTVSARRVPLLPAQGPFLPSPPSTPAGSPLPVTPGFSTSSFCSLPGSLYSARRWGRWGQGPGTSHIHVSWVPRSLLQLFCFSRIRFGGNQGSRLAESGHQGRAQRPVPLHGRRRQDARAGRCRQQAGGPRTGACRAGEGRWIRSRVRRLPPARGARRCEGEADCKGRIKLPSDAFLWKFRVPAAGAWVKAAFALTVDPKAGPVGWGEPVTWLILTRKTHLGPLQAGPALGWSSSRLPSPQYLKKKEKEKRVCPQCGSFSEGHSSNNSGESDIEGGRHFFN